MAEGEQFETFVRVTLERYGIAVDEVDLAVMRAAEATYGPGRDALIAADLSGVPPEHDLDPSRAPNPAPGR
jgi:hypothetical protein